MSRIDMQALSFQNTHWLCPRTKRHRKDRQCYGSRCIRLPSPCRSCTDPPVVLKDKILVCTTLVPKHLSGWTIWLSARHRATSGLLFLLRETELCSLKLSWEQNAQCQTTLVVRSVTTVRVCLILALCKVISRHATTLSFALLLNLRSQYPKANLEQLSLSLWE